MKNIIILASLILGLWGCTSQTESQKPNLSCQDEYDQYNKRYSDIISRFPTSPSEAQSALAKLEKDLLVTMQRCKDDPNLIILTAEVDIARGENGKALLYAKQAEALSPNTGDANNTLGNVLILTGDLEQGIKYIEKASLLAPDLMYIKANLCSNYEMAKRYKDAIKVCTEAIESKDTKLLGPSLYVRARAYKALGQLKQAELDFKRAKSVGIDGEKYYSKEHLEGGKIE